MNLTANIQEINARHPQARDQALAKLRASSSKMAALPAEDLKWSWFLAIVFSAQSPAAALQSMLAGASAGVSSANSGSASSSAGASKGKGAGKKAAVSALDESFRETDPQAYCDAHLAHDFRLVLGCEGRYYSDPVFVAPSALVDAYRIEPYAPALAKFILPLLQSHKGRPAAVFQIAIEGVYEKKGQLIAVDADNMLHELSPSEGVAFWGGGLRRSARGSFDACAPGGVFRYRNAPMRKLTDAEVATLLSQRAAWVFGGMSPSVGGGLAFARPKLSAATLVFGPGAEDHPNAQPLGTAASLGLIAAPVSSPAGSAAAASGASAKTASAKAVAAKNAKKGKAKP